MSDAIVEIRGLGGDGSPGDLIVDPVMTNSDGEWQAIIPAEQAGTDFLVVVNGGSYVDEATTNTVVLPPGTELVGWSSPAIWRTWLSQHF